MPKFRKKPVVIEAMQYLGTLESHAAVAAFVGARAVCRVCGGHGEYEGEYGPRPCMPCIVGAFYIDTLEGQMCALDGDWIIKGVAGEFYPCKPDIFEATYEEVSDA